MKRHTLVTAGLVPAGLAGASGVFAYEVTDWDRNMLHAALVAKTSPMVTSRVGAMVQTAVFDAVNAIERRHQPIHVPAGARPAASARVAAAQAAYTILVDLFRAQKGDFDAELAASLAASPAQR